jgi:hypothetical protein
LELLFAALGGSFIGLSCFTGLSRAFIRMAAIFTPVFLDQNYVFRLGLAPALVHSLGEFHVLPDIEGIRAAIYVADMHENVAAPIVSLNEAESLFINPTHDFSGRHFVRPISMLATS